MAVGVKVRSARIRAETGTGAEHVLRGLLLGSAYGALIAGCGLAVASLLSEQPAGNTPPAEPQVAAPQVAPVSDPDVAPAAPLAVTPEGIQVEAPSFGAPSQGTTSAPLADTLPAERPEAAVVDPQIAAPSTETSASPSVVVEAPVLPAPLAAAPETPENEADVVVSTDPASTIEVTEADEPLLDVVEIEPEQAEPEVDEPEAPPVVEDTGPAAPEAPVADTADTPSSEQDQAVEMAVVEGLSTPEAEAPAEVPIIAVPVEPAPEPAPEPDATPEPEPEPEPEPTTPSVGLSGPSASALPSNSGGITIRRPNEGTVIAEPAIPALEAFAAVADNPDGLPMLSVVVIDDGQLGNGPVLLQTVPFPVTVAVHVTDDAATAKMEAYRAAGFEVLAMVGLPEGATEADVAMVTEATFAVLPEAIGILDDGDMGLTGPSTEVLMDRLARDGRAFVTVPQGLNSALRVADAASVPAVVIERDLDGAGQNADVIRRFLDRSAFQARQSDGIVLLARLRADTVTALTIWSTANRASQVAQVPASAVLLAK
jgi:polysaccharide deacetylase 2 family uncharacterized protein YibQ